MRAASGSFRERLGISGEEEHMDYKQKYNICADNEHKDCLLILHSHDASKSGLTTTGKHCYGQFNARMRMPVMFVPSNENHFCRLVSRLFNITVVCP